MTYLLAMNETRKTVLAPHVRAASSLWSRCVGLLTTASLSGDEGLWLSPCQSIHMFFMRYPIDVLFLDARGTVLQGKTYRPWQMSGWVARSKGALELAAGTLTKTGTQVGDVVTVRNS